VTARPTHPSGNTGPPRAARPQLQPRCSPLRPGTLQSGGEATGAAATTAPPASGKARAAVVARAGQNAGAASVACTPSCCGLAARSEVCSPARHADISHLSDRLGVTQRQTFLLDLGQTSRITELRFLHTQPGKRIPSGHHKPAPQGSCLQPN